MKNFDVIVVGAGPAGMMAAITSAQNNNHVLLIDKNDFLGRKILATGNGRCNLTNTDVRAQSYYGANDDFIKKVLENFDNKETIKFFESSGVLLKTEDRGRVFPRTNQAQTIVSALEQRLVDSGIKTEKCTEVKDVCKDDGLFKVKTDKGEYTSRKLILSTGGKAAHQFGSSGDGIFFAKKLGHKIVPIHAALCPIETVEDTREIQGIKITTKISSYVDNKKLLDTSGDAIFTHFGVSGPAAMAQSRVVSPALDSGQVYLCLDFFPELSSTELDGMLEDILRNNPKKSLRNSLSGCLVSGLVPAVLERAELSGTEKSAELSKKKRLALVAALKSFKLHVKKIRPLKEAQVTSGGVDASDIKTESLESKIVPGLYFAGEIIDVDGDSGGFNLQWAWSSGHLAGELS